MCVAIVNDRAAKRGRGWIGSEFTGKLREFFGTEETSQIRLELSRDFLTEDVQRVLQSAYEFAEKDQSQIEPQHLWAAVLAEAPHFLKQVFEKLSFPVEFEQVEDEAASEAEEHSLADDLTERLSPIMRQALGAQDLTFLALSGGSPLAMERSFLEGDVYEKIARSLFRSEAKHVVLTGDKGVGKTVVLRELARRAAEGRYPFLADKRFLRLDCSSVPAGWHWQKGVKRMGCVCHWLCQCGFETIVETKLGWDCVLLRRQLPLLLGTRNHQGLIARTFHRGTGRASGTQDPPVPPCRGQKLNHFEIVPRQAMSPERFQELVNQIKLVPAGG